VFKHGSDSGAGGERAGRRAHWLALVLFSWPLAGLCGCANFWDDLTSREHDVKGYFYPPDPRQVLADPNADGNKKARALRALREPKQFGGSEQDQETVLTTLSSAAATDRSVWCRLAAVHSLGRFQDARAVQSLETAYDQAGSVPHDGIQPATYLLATGAFQPEQVGRLRCEVLAALGETGNPDAMKFLVGVVGDKVPLEGADQEKQLRLDERLAAARALGKFKGDQRVAGVLFRVMRTETDPAMKGVARESLVKVTGKDLPADDKGWDDLMTGRPPEAGPADPTPAPKKLFGWF
jgi:HEAT repeats